MSQDPDVLVVGGGPEGKHGGGNRWNVTLVADVNRDGHRLAGDPGHY